MTSCLEENEVRIFIDKMLSVIPAIDLIIDFLYKIDKVNCELIKTMAAGLM